MQNAGASQAPNRPTYTGAVGTQATACPAILFTTAGTTAYGMQCTSKATQTTAQWRHLTAITAGYPLLHMHELSTDGSPQRVANLKSS
jgi:hypothetical protein